LYVFPPFKINIGSDWLHKSNRVKSTHSFIKIIPLLGFIISSCRNDSGDIPLSVESEFSQPISRAVKFSEPFKIPWSDSLTDVKPLIKKLDLSNPASRIFDSAAFIPFSKKPKTVPFDWSLLSDSVWDYDKLSSKPLLYETSILEPPKLVKAGNISLKAGSSLSFEFGGFQDLTGTTVECLFQDRTGFIWMATEHWIIRYDGETMMLVWHIPLYTEVTSFLQDKEGNIWLGTGIGEGNGVFVIDEKAGIIKHLKLELGVASKIIDMKEDSRKRIWLVNENPNAPINIIDVDMKTIKYFGRKNGLSDNSVTGLSLDGKNNMWLCTKGSGINIIDLNKGKIIYLNKQHGLYTDSLSLVTMDSLKRMWVASRYGELHEIDVKKGLITYFNKDQGLDKHFVNNILIDKKGNILLGTQGNGRVVQANGIIVIDPRHEAYRIINTTNGLDGNFMLAMLEDKLGQIWAGVSESGLNILNRNGLDLKHFGENEITSLAEDSVGQIWIGSLDTKSSVKILNLSTGLIKPLKLSTGPYHDSVQDILIQQGRIIISTVNGIDIIEDGSNQTNHFGKAQGLSSDDGIGFMEDTQGNIWIDAESKNGIGINILNPQKKTIRRIIASREFDLLSITDVKQDQQGQVWIGTFSRGIYLLDLEKNSVRFLKNELLQGNGYKIFKPDNQGNMWIGNGNGVFMINSKRDSLTSFSTREGLMNNEIYAINENNGRIYVATFTGLSILSPPQFSAEKKWRVESLGKRQGIYKPNETLISTVVTKKGQYLWGTKGITISDNFVADSSGAYICITGIDIFNQPQYFTDNPWLQLRENDSLWNYKKDSFFIKGQLPANLLFPEQAKMKWDSVDHTYNMPVNLRLPYDQNALQFHFNQINLGRQDTTWYRYNLQGEDTKWSEKTYNSISKNYINLRPGNYIFRVSGLYHGSWIKPTAFSFTILPPWWQTGWAYTLDVLIVLGIAWSYAKYRSRHLKKENLILEDRIAQRTVQLSQSLENLKMTQKQLIQSEKMASLGELTAGIAHEIQNPLNFVNNFSEVNLEMTGELRDKIVNLDLSNKEKSDIQELMTNIEQNEKKINHHGKRADAIVKGMLQHSRSSHGIKEATDFNALADEYLRLSYHGLRAKDKSSNARLETNFDPSVGIINIIPQDMGRVLLNLYNNALYSIGEKKKVQTSEFEPAITVTTKKLNGKVELRVKDNGIGVPQKVLDKIFQPFFTTKPPGDGTGLGLSLSYDIIKAHQGDIQVETKEGDGAEFIITIPVNYVV